MAIDLKNIDLNGTAASSTRKTSTPHSTTSRAADSDASQQAPVSDVSITSTASLLSQVQSTLASQPAVDQKRVDAISNAISQGTYKVNPEAIANGLIQSERTLGKLKEF
jgi:negative regulator of flagellin synthesis FlgM